MFSGAGLLVAQACNICPFMLRLVLCRCILNYSLCWRITALFIKGGDNFFGSPYSRVVFSQRAKTVFSNSCMLHMQSARHIYKAAGEILVNARLSKSKLHFSAHALCIYQGDQGELISDERTGVESI